MSDLAQALVASLDDAALDYLAELLRPRLALETAQADGWLNTAQAAEHLALSVDSVQRLAAAGRLPCSQDVPNGKRFFLRSELDAWRRRGG